MLYVVAIGLSPIAVLLCQRRVQGVLNAALWLGTLMTGPGPLTLIPIFHALMVVHLFLWDRRLDRMVLDVWQDRVPRGALTVATVSVCREHAS